MQIEPQKYIDKEVVELKHYYRWPLDTLRYNVPNRGRFLIYSPFLLSTEELQKRIAASHEKIQFAKQYNSFWKSLPWVHMVSITGSVASLNALPSDDIDLWIIVNKRRIWMTRLLDYFYFKMKGVRRFKNSQNVKNKLCINFYKTTENLELSKKNVRFACQAVDAISIYARTPFIYREVFAHNNWIRHYFQSWYDFQLQALPESKIISSRNVFSNFLDIIEYFLGVVQLFKQTKRLHLNPSDIFVNEFTTWQKEQ